MPEREQPGEGRKKAWPTVVILGSQSVKNAATATGRTVGFDAGKLVKGCKRLVLTDTLGHVLASRVLPANAADGPAAIVFWDEVAAAHDLLGQVQVVFVDSSFNGVFRAHLAQRYGIRVEKPAHVLVEKTNFCIHAWRWIVERTFCIVPRRDGVFSGLEFRTDLWDKYSMAAPAQRRQYGALSNTARKAYKA